MELRRRRIPGCLPRPEMVDEPLPSNQAACDFDEFCKSLPGIRKLLHTPVAWESGGCVKFMQGQSFAKWQLGDSPAEILPGNLPCLDLSRTGTTVTRPSL